VKIMSFGWINFKELCFGFVGFKKVLFLNLHAGCRSCNEYNNKNICMDPFNGVHAEKYKKQHLEKN
jgi:hypothetical protein